MKQNSQSLYQEHAQGWWERLLGYPADARLLILNADDFGMCHSVNEAIISTLEAGVVRSTSLMTPCPWALQAMEFLRLHPEVSFGIHLTAIWDADSYTWGPLTCREKDIGLAGISKRSAATWGGGHPLLPAVYGFAQTHRIRAPWWIKIDPAILDHAAFPQWQHGEMFVACLHPRAKGPLKITQGQIYERETAYNYIEVIERDGFRDLRLNEGQGVHSKWHATQLNYGGPWQQFLVAPFYNASPYQPGQVQRMAIIGLAAGTVARQAVAVFGPLPIDGYEIDPAIIEVGRQYFDMNMPTLTAYAEDGRYGLNNSPEHYSIIAVDAYRPPYIPAHLTTQQFFQQAADHLTQDGVLAINVGRSPTDRTLINDLASTLQTVFPSVYVVDVPYSYNTMIYATHLPTNSANLAENFLALTAQADTHPLLLEAMQIAILNSQPTPPLDVVYTDDWSPIEWVTNTMVLNTVLFGDLDQIGQ